MQLLASAHRHPEIYIIRTDYRRQLTTYTTILLLRHPNGASALIINIWTYEATIETR